MKKYDDGFWESYGSTLPEDGCISYHCISCLKEAEEGGVYLVSLPGIEEHAILKTGGEAVLREYKRLKQVQDIPGVHLPRVFCCWQHDGVWHLIKQYIPGHTLAQWRDEKEEVTQAEMIDLGIKVCDVLQRLHACGWIVRDVKPDNFVYTEEKRLYLIDVDTVRRYVPSQGRDTQYLGTPGYAAPEQYGFGQTSERTDIYGLGQLLYFLAGGTLDEQTFSPKHIPFRLRHIIRKCTAFNPKRRYRKASSVAAALRMVRWKPVLAAVLALCLMGAGIAVKLQGTQQKSQPVYATLQEEINAVPKWASRTITLDGEYVLTEPLWIESRQIVFEGDGVIRDGEALNGTALVVITTDAKLTLNEGVTLHVNHEHDAVDNQGVFELNGGKISCWSVEKGKLFVNGTRGQMYIRQGEMLFDGKHQYVDWIAHNDGYLELEGGMIRATGVSYGILNKGKAKLSGGILKMYPPVQKTALPLHNYEDGYDFGRSTVFEVNDQKVIWQSESQH